MSEDREPSTRLVGSWRLVSVQLEMADTAERIDLLGSNPTGRLTLTRGGGWMTILTATDRRPATDHASVAALFESMMAYSGKFRIEGDDRIIVSVDLSWHPAWIGTEQVRFFKIEGDRLSIRSGLQTHPARPGKSVYGVIGWQREP